MIPNIMGHLPLTEHIKAFSICFQLLGQQFDFSVFCSNSLAYGIVQKKMANFPKIAEIWYKLTVFKDISQVAQNPIKTNGSLQANATF